MRTVISVCDYSGTWAKPYADKGYFVILVDPKHPLGEDGSPWTFKEGMHCFSGTAGEVCVDPRKWLEDFQDREMAESLQIHGLLLAPVCTHFTVSGAQHWPAKDADGRTAEGLRLVDECLFLTTVWDVEFWALENPVGRLPKLRPQLGKPLMYFHPHYFAGWADDPQQDAYTKKTGLWGKFNMSLHRRLVEPVVYEKGGKRGSWMWAFLGGKSDRTKELRSITPVGFSRAFCEANP